MTDNRIDAIPTRWSLVRHPDAANKPETVAELRRLLVLRYASAVRRYVGAMVQDHDDADELAQDVIMRLMRGDFAGADPSKGRFRDLLKTAIRNMVRNHWDRSNRRKTSDLNLDVVLDSNAAFEQDQEWTSTWQRSVLDHTWARMQAEDQQLAQSGKSSSATKLLRLRTAHPEASSEELASLLSEQLGTTIKPDNCRQMLRRARLRFAEHLVDEVRSGLDDESDDRLQEELSALNLLDWVRDYRR